MIATVAEADPGFCGDRPRERLIFKGFAADALAGVRICRGRRGI